MFFETLRLAIQAIIRNALRSALTVLGIVVGVAAVVTMVTIGNGATAKVTEEMSKLGTNLLFVRPGQSGPGRASSEARSFDGRDIAALRTQVRGVRAVAPVAQQTVTAIYGSQSRSTTVMGTDNDFLITQDWALAQGRQFLEGEVRGGRAACILGQTVRGELLGRQPALGQRIRVGKISCEVIGILEPKGQSSFGRDRDDAIVMPLRAFQRRISGSTAITTIYVSAAEGTRTANVQARIERLLRERRNIGPRAPDDFSVRDMKQIAESQTTTTGVLTALLGAVAGISLLVGGIGIMNIMLVSVTERTREIGIRLAIGAQEAQVLMQFLVEAVVLSLCGGLVGVAGGLAIAALATRWMHLPLILDPTIVLIAFGFSAAIGVIFGYFPARRAARLDPIEALRHE